MLGAFVLLAILGVVFALIPWRITSNAMQQDIEHRLRLVLDAPDAKFGRMTLTFLPTPRVRISDVTFSQQNGRVAGSVRVLKAGLRISAVFRGIAKPNSVDLLGPKLTVRMPELGEDAVAGAQNVTATFAEYIAKAGSIAGLAEIGIHNGQITVVGSSQTFALDDVRLVASLPSRSKSLKIAGQLTRDGDPIRVAFSGATPDYLAKGTTEPIAALAESARWAVEFNGTGSLAKGIAIKGAISARYAPDVATPYKAALDLAGFAPSAATIVRASLDSSVRGTSLTELVITSGQHRFEGVGAIRRESARWQVNATLATARADLTPLLSHIRAMYDPDKGWNSSRLAIEPLFGMNADIRLSADRLVIGPQQITQAAIAVITRPGRIEASLGDGTVETGRARGRVIVSRQFEDLELRANGTVEDINFGQLATKLNLPHRLSGIGTGDFSFETIGSSIAQMVSQLDGKVQLGLRAGELVGIDLLRMASRRNAPRNTTLTEALGGKTPFESASFTAKITRGLVAPVDAVMNAQLLVGNLSGDIDLGSAIINLVGAVVQIPTESGQSEPRPIIDFTINGPLFDPRVTPNMATILRRS